MNIELSPGIFYTGVNDRTTHLFESLWPLPFGISYNSYLIVDDKVTLIDIAEESMREQHFMKIKAVLGEREIDYVIINHMEPDHTGALRDLYERYPNITVIGNAKTQAMLEGFYGIRPNFIVIKDQEELSIGKHTLRFYLTPMVHWPETMMTYCVEDGILFSGDAFGCFGALHGSVVDYQMNLDIYWGEMRRYYAAIVGKYGTPVQNALTKVGKESIKMICSTHGPVWKEFIRDVIHLYDRYSRYDTDAGVVVAYGSMYGHTGAIAEKIAESLAENGIRNIDVFDVSRTDISFILSAIFAWKGLILGSPVYNGELFPPVQALMNAIQSRDIKDHLFGSFGTFAWGSAPLGLFDQFCTRMKWENVYPTIEQKYALQDYQFSPADALGHSMATALKEVTKHS